MFKKVVLGLAVSLALTALCFDQVTKAVEAVVLKTQQEKISYLIGRDIGKNLKAQQTDFDMKTLFKGITDELSGAGNPLSEAEIKEAVATFNQEMLEKQQERLKQLAEQNKKAGAEFLAANQAKAGVVTLSSGLQYKVLQAGTGPKPTAADTVSVHYRGTLINGTEFDSSYKRGQPAKFGVTGVIPGWVEALQLMKVGSKWQLFIPPHLAYGERGAGGQIGPNATLLFEVELLAIESGK